MTTHTLHVPDIHCEGCLRTIARVLTALPGVDSVGGDPKEKVIHVQFRPEAISLAAVADALAAAGFPVAGAPARREAWRQWVPLLLTVLGAALAGWLGYRLGFWRFVTTIAMPQAFGRYNLFLLSVGAGLAAFFSPCVFPLLPGYVTQDLGLQGGRHRLTRALTLGLAAALGVIAVNVAIGAVIAALGRATPFQPDPRRDAAAILVIRTLAGAAIAGLGVLTLTGRSPAAGLLARVLPVPPAMTPRGVRSMFFSGFFYNAAGIGCTGPILLSLSLFALTAGSAAAALGAFLAFSLTMGVLMVAITLLAGLSQAVLVQRLRVATPFLHRLGGAVMIVVGGYTAVSLATGPGRAIFVRIFLSFLP